MSATTAAVAAPRPRSLAGEQLLVATGQLAAGVGNLAFSLAAARLLAPGAFADLAAFLGLYLLVHVPAASLSAGSALAPGLADRARGNALRGGCAAGILFALAAVPLGALLHLPAAMLLALAVAAPIAGLIALERGRLYGLGRPNRAAASLLAEPAVRLTVGVGLGALAGPAGAALGVTIAGYAALIVARPALIWRPRTRDAGAAGRPDEGLGASAPAMAILAFLALAVLQTQDVLVANALLPSGEAGSFAVLSTLGGIAAFATTTVPLMLLPRAVAGQRGALPTALGIAAALGAAAVAVVAVDPERLVSAIFGARYADVAGLAVSYMVAMALLGVARVLIAHACATGAARASMAIVSGAIALHLGLLVALGDNAAGMARATLIATTALTVSAGGAAVLRLPPSSAAALRARVPPAVPVALALAGFAAVAVVLRLVPYRSLWLDEGTSIAQAQMAFGEMLETLRYGDVHPPLHHAVLWVTVRLLDTSELAVRLPSLLATVALVPVLYLAGRELYDRRTGLAAAALVAVAPFCVWYGQEARMYAIFMLLAALALWLQVRAVRRGHARDWVLFAVVTALMIWTQYFALLLVGAQQLGFLAALLSPGVDRARRRALLRGWLSSGFLILLAVLPLAPFALDQFRVNESAGKGFGTAVPSQAGGGVSNPEGLPQPTVYSALTNILWAVGGYHSDATMTRLGALWPLSLLGGFMLLGRRHSRMTLLLVGCALLPMAGLFVIGQLKPFVFEVRYFPATAPIALLLIGRVATLWTPRAVPGAVVVAALCAVLAVGVADQQLNSSNPRQYDFRAALDEIERRAGPRDVLVYHPSHLGELVAYYGETLRARADDGRLPRPPRGGRLFVMASFLDRPENRRRMLAEIADLERRARPVDAFRRPNIRVWEFAR